MTRVNVLGIPIDNLPAEELSARIMRIHSRPGPVRIVFLSFADFVRARRLPRHAALVRAATLVIPVSRTLSLLSGYLCGESVVWYHPFDFIVRLLAVLEHQHRRCFVVGGTRAQLAVAEANIRRTFPKLMFVGRHSGYFAPDRERDIQTAVDKAAPDMWFVGPGVPKGAFWPPLRRWRSVTGIAVWSDTAFDVFCERRRRPPRHRIATGRNEQLALLLNPFAWPQVFDYAVIWLRALLVRLTRPAGAGTRSSKPVC